VNGFIGAFELIDRAGHVLHRVRVERLPFRIGRALDNELVLEDPYACARHAELRAGPEGGVELVDLGSRNGSFLGQERQRRERFDLSAGGTIRLGHTILRYRPADERLPETEADPLATSRLHGLDRPWPALAAVALAATVMAVQSLIGSVQLIKPGTLAGMVMPALLVLALWALAWALVNRLVSHRFHYAGHLTVASLGLVMANAIDTFIGYAGFAFALDELMADLRQWLLAAVIALVVYAHLRLISRGRSQALVLPAAVVGVGWVTLSLLPSLGDERFQSEPSLASSLKPPVAAVAGGKNPEAFYEAALDAFAAADEEAASEE
jgi:pSer/pThr/pTyr-binding forkhead associated (FHA) protein